MGEAALRGRPGWWVAVAALATVGLLLRVAGAQGGLWTDEAWSSIYADEAGGPAGVFLRINHDNNHHLYSLWFQVAGWGASPLLLRAPAIAAGTIGTVLAALIAGRKSPYAGLVAALLFAVSPTFVAFSSEARGYAFMLLATLAMLLLVLTAVERDARPRTGWRLGLIAALGTLSHMTMVAPVALITFWLYLDRRSEMGPDRALPETARLMGPAVLATVVIVTFVVIAAAASPTGMRIGGYKPFRLQDFVRALDEMASWTGGFPSLPVSVAALAVGIVALAIFIRPPAWLGSRGRLYAVLILGVPLGIAVVQPGNAGFARYYLCSGIGLLLLLSEVLGHGLRRGPATRTGCAAVLALCVTLGLARDWQLIALQRGDPDRAVRSMAELSPGGASVTIEPRRFEAILRASAHRAGYAIRFGQACPGSDFVLRKRLADAGPPGSIIRCGIRYDLIGSSRTIPLTGDAWLLYAAERLQTARSPVSGRGKAH